MLSKRLIQVVLDAERSGRPFGSLAGVTLPSSRNLWDILKRHQIEPHDARHIVDIWNEVRMSKKPEVTIH